MSYSDVAGTVGVVVSGGGFYFAWTQLRKTAKATTVSSETLRRAESRMSVSHLLVLVTQLRLLESDLETARKSTNRELAIVALSHWAHVASETAGYLNDQGIAPDIVKPLQHSAAVARKSKSDLAFGAKKETTILRQADEALSPVMSELGALQQQLTSASTKRN